MKVDFKCMRDIMLTLENILQPDETGIIAEISPSQLCLAMSDLNYSNGVILAHLQILFKCGALEQGSIWINETITNIADISYPDGYSLIENLRSPDAVELLYKVLINGLPEKVADVIKELNRTKADLLKQ